MSKTDTPPPGGTAREQHNAPAPPASADDRVVSTADAAAVDQFLREAPGARAWLRSVVETNARSPLPAPPADLGYFAAAVEVIRAHADGRAMLRTVVARTDGRRDGATARDEAPSSPSSESTSCADGCGCVPSPLAAERARQSAEFRDWVRNVAQQIRLANNRVQSRPAAAPGPSALAEKQLRQAAEFRDWIRGIVPPHIRLAYERLQARVAAATATSTAPETSVPPASAEGTPPPARSNEVSQRRTVVDAATGDGPRGECPEAPELGEEALVEPGDLREMEENPNATVPTLDRTGATRVKAAPTSWSGRPFVASSHRSPRKPRRDILKPFSRAGPTSRPEQPRGLSR